MSDAKPAPVSAPQPEHHHPVVPARGLEATLELPFALMMPGEGRRGRSSATPIPADQLVRAEGVVQRVVFASPDGEFAILQLEEATRTAPLYVLGMLAGIQPGETLRVLGIWENHAAHGKQLRALQALPISPQTRLGLERYLATLTGLGPELARRIVLELGLDALDTLERETFRVAQIKGVGKRRAARALADAMTRRQEREVMVFLQGLGVSAAYASRIRKRYGQASIAKVKENPYALARDIAGIGFHIADRIAQLVGIHPLSPLRCAAGLLHTLEQAGDIGHCYLPQAELVEKAVQLLRLPELPAPLTLPPVAGESAPPESAQLGLSPVGAVQADAPVDAALPAVTPGQPLEVPRELVQNALDEMVYKTELVRDQGHVYLRRSFDAEVELAELLGKLSLGRRLRVPHVDLQRTQLRLAEGQQAALLQVEQAPVCVITGGPGTGKTTIIRTLVQTWAQAGLQVRLTAPTGRAAKRLSEATGQRACTVHRLLEMVPGETLMRRSDKQLECDLLVCDEASMLDLQLALALVRALSPGTTLVFVGDVDQLPSVGPGRVLADLIDSGVVMFTRLREIFRQAEGSGIIENAHRILAGQLPISAARGTELADFYWIEAAEAVTARDLVVRLLTERIPQRFSLDPLTDIQVLTPMHRGEVGTEELNRALQLALNPVVQQVTAQGVGNLPVLKSRGRLLAVGDKVMQIRNDYERDVWNGDVGLVSGVDLEEGALTVRFDDDREVVYDSEALDQLELAYAVSVHKSQGSEYKAVVVPLHIQHYPLLRRNLLYTAVTRGKKLVVLVSSARALRRAVSEIGDLTRYTRLADRLRSILPR